MSLVFGKSVKSKLLVSLVALVVLLAMLVVFLPVIIKFSAQSWLRDQGLDANIEFVGFNVNNGTFLLEKAKGVNTKNKGFVLDRVLVEINWKPLFSKQLDIQRVKIEGLTLDLESSAKGLTVAGISLPGKTPGKEKVASPAENEPTGWSVQVQGIELANIKLCHDNPAVKASDILTVDKMMKACASLDHLKWQGLIGWSAPGKNRPATAGIQVAGDLLVENLRHASLNQKQHFVNLGKATINQFQATGLELFRTEQVVIENVDLLQHSQNQGAPFLASWQSLRINRPEFNKQKDNARVGAVSLSGLRANIVRTKSGITGVPVFSRDKQDAKTEKATTTATPFTFAIKKIAIGDNSQVSFVDNTVEPVFKELLTNINVSLGDLDSAQPGVKSPLLVTVKVSDYGEVNIEGMIQPFANRVTIDLKQTIKNIDLANYNVYGKTFIGHKIHSGHLDVEQKIKITEGHMDTTSTMVLNKFKVESLKGDEAEKYKKDLGIPLSTALSLLKDKNDNIKLTIPVTGDMNKPDFSMNDIIATVTSKAIKEAIINYYTPFGLVKLLGGVVDLATGLNFEPVVFAAGKTGLEQQGIDELTRLSKLLSERPQVQLTFCGHPAKSDILARYKPGQLGLDSGDDKKPLNLTDKQTSELLALFRSRMDNMKKYMVNELKVNPGQVLLCSEPDNKNWVSGLDTQPGITVSI